MKIVAISGPSQRAELGSKPLPAGFQWAWNGQVPGPGMYPDAMLYIDLDFMPDPERVEALSRLLPTPVLINSVVHTLREIGGPFVRINAWPGFAGNSVHELAVSDAHAASSIASVYERLGWQCRIVPDIPGMISARVIATVVNEAYYTLEDEVSTKSEIDTAMRLGTNYPMGPFEWCEKIGPGKIGHLLDVLSKTDKRYMPSSAFKADLDRSNSN